jgi:hypothetical protein
MESSARLTGQGMMIHQSIATGAVETAVSIRTAGGITPTGTGITTANATAIIATEEKVAESERATAVVRETGTHTTLMTDAGIMTTANAGKETVTVMTGMGVIMATETEKAIVATLITMAAIMTETVTETVVTYAIRVAPTTITVAVTETATDVVMTSVIVAIAVIERVALVARLGNLSH